MLFQHTSNFPSLFVREYTSLVYFDSVHLSTFRVIRWPTSLVRVLFLIFPLIRNYLFSSINCIPHPLFSSVNYSLREDSSVISLHAHGYSVLRIARIVHALLAVSIPIPVRCI